ncbi:MAG: 2-hydroxyacid dehydrogenase [Rubrivivax sp.]|nr:2-hydroxyacid dehydrogenase [Rubrivivax sp.]
MHDLLQIGPFPTLAQNLIDAEYRCHSRQDLELDENLRSRVQGIITRSNFAVSEEVIASLPRLGIIAICGVGYDLVALDAACRRGVVVTHTPEVLNSAVAELCIGMLLALLRRLPQADRFVRAGAWQRSVFPLASNLAGKRIGIVGLGRIGKEIAHRLEPFGVALSYFGRTDQRLQWRFEPDLHALARTSDVLILAAPGGSATACMVDASVLAELGPDGFLVNVARGSLVDEPALLDALSHRAIAGAALDVFDHEPDIDARWLALDNVVLTPHIGSATDETRLAMARLTLDNLHSFFERGAALTPVDAAMPA